MRIGNTSRDRKREREGKEREREREREREGIEIPHSYCVLTLPK